MTRNFRGFTLLELMITTAILVVISGAALALFSRQQPLFTQQQNQAGLNIAIRNAVAQLQLDVVNAGSGTVMGPNVLNPPVGVSIINNVPNSACNNAATFTYGPNCFDQLTVITADPNTAPAHPDNGTYTLNSGDSILTTSSPIYLVPPTGTSVANATAYAASFHNGDELLLITANTNSTIQSYTTIMLNANGSVHTSGVNSFVQLSFNPTSGSPAGTNTSANDPLSISLNDPSCVSPCEPNTYLTDNFSYTDWVIRLEPTYYWVDTSNTADPKLSRTQGGAISSPCAQPTCSVLAEQVIGFKVGAMLWDKLASNDNPGGYYDYDSSNNGYAFSFWQVRSVQISLIGRTTPNYSPTFTYRNGFDGGPYQIESVSVVVNPRNLSFNNQ